MPLRRTSVVAGRRPCRLRRRPARRLRRRRQVRADHPRRRREPCGRHRPRLGDLVGAQGGTGLPCPRTAKRRRSPRTPSPTTLTSTRSSARTARHRSRSSRTSSRCQNPQGGPNFFEFGDDVLYEIHISNGGDAKADVTYQFRFPTKIRNPKTFLYNTGPITSIGDPTLNRPQTYSVTRVARAVKSRARAGARRARRSTSASAAPRTTRTSPLRPRTVCRADGWSSPGSAPTGFFVDLGSIFDLGRCVRSRTCTSSRWPPPRASTGSRA